MGGERLVTGSLVASMHYVHLQRHWCVSLPIAHDDEHQLVNDESMLIFAMRLALKNFLSNRKIFRGRMIGHWRQVCGFFFA